ncbi:ComF family protein [Marinobacter sp. TBZ242]|uniref:ComF family protein n=1 Tax=Marinobacter azerbaijanicus TaxID=3050455 RepID=A0ABT7ID67_9GAMM|nr:ComF family protein [Marinobacter sp. TBZ242]MDL0432094.1 ComF family protein [Marinobacter sp. TBZ242]
MKQMIKGLRLLSTLLTPKVNSGERIHHSVRGILCSAGGQCVACLEPNAHFGLCTPCRQDLPANHWHCRQCALPLAFEGNDRLCGQCLQDPPPFSGVIAPWRYRFPVDSMIQRYKYNGQRTFARPLINDLAEHLVSVLEAAPERRPELLVASPMHPARRRQRGFNQAADIAEQISIRCGIPWTTELVIRNRRTRPQRGLSREERLANLTRIFHVTRRAPERIAIVDDVVTTGATARSLTIALLEAGARDVQIWALARTPG